MFTKRSLKIITFLLIFPILSLAIVTAYDSYVNDPRLSQADGHIIKSFSAFDELKERIVHVLKNGSPH